MTAEFELLKLLRCPDTRTELARADDDVVADLNARILAGRVTTVGGRKLDKPLTGALVRADGRVAYPLMDGVPLLLVDEGIPIDP